MANMKLADMIKQFFESQEWKYDFMEEEGVFQSAVGLTEDTAAMIHVIVGESAYTVMIAPMLPEPVQNVDEIRNFINDLNARLMVGGLVFDTSEGVLFFRVSQICAGQLPSAETVTESFTYPIDFVGENFDIFAKLFDGTMNADAALNAMFSDGE